MILIYHITPSQNIGSVQNISILSMDEHNDDENIYNFLCDFNSNITRLLFVTHHKTGTRLFNDGLLLHIFNYWAQKCLYNDTMDTYKFTNELLKDSARLYSSKSFNTNSHPRLQHITQFVNKFTHKQEKFKWSKRMFILHSIRDPIDTVLSGYNYHKHTKEEWWIQQKIVDITHFADFCKSMKVFMMEEYPNLVNKSLQDIYNLMDDIGIIIEYIRYKICEYKDICDIYQYMEYKLIPKYAANENMQFVNMRLENFKTSFNQTLKLMFDYLGVIDRKDRSNLFDGLQILDFNRIKDDKHVTDGKYNKSAQIKLLLNDTTRCETLKKFTLSLDYLWKYQTYC